MKCRYITHSTKNVHIFTIVMKYQHEVHRNNFPAIFSDKKKSAKLIELIENWQSFVTFRECNMCQKHWVLIINESLGLIFSYQ